MTKIVFYKSNGTYYGFRESGHSGFDDLNRDVVCAAISAMTMLVINTIEVSIGSSVDYTVDDKTTDITVVAKGALPEYETDKERRFACSAVIKGYFLQLVDMLEEYYDYIDVDEIESKDLIC